MLKNWLKIAFINYKKNWLSTIINLFGLTIGLTGFMLILMHWNDEESYEKWNPKRIISIISKLITKKKILMERYFCSFGRKCIKTNLEVEDYVLMNGSDMSYKMTTKHTTAYQKGGMSVSEIFPTCSHSN
jgi:putative ABC transport system permease protein